MDDLEAAATAYAIGPAPERECPACGESTAWPVDKNAFIAGAKWQREQLKAVSVGVIDGGTTSTGRSYIIPVAAFDDKQGAEK